MHAESEGFERYVAQLFRSLGGEVWVNVPVGGHQIDVVVRDMLDSGVSLTIAIECKHFNKRVGVSEVTDFAAVLNDLRALRLADSGAMVTNIGYTGPARNNASANHVQLIEAADLESRRDMNLTQASESVADAVEQARRMHRMVSELLGADDPSSGEWNSVQLDVKKCVKQILELADTHARASRGSILDRRVQNAIAHIAEESERCEDGVWYLRQVLKMKDDRDELPPLQAGEADRTSAVLIRLRELDAARSQIRRRFARLEETCLRYTYPNRSII